MMFDLSGKTILIIGGRGYLGREFCQKFRQQNAVVVSADLPETSAAAAKSDFKEEFDDVFQMDVDVTDRASIASVVRAVEEQFGPIDTFVYSVTAKPGDFYLPITECSLEGWQSVIRVELDGLFMAVQEVGKFMEARNRGTMIFISSIYGIVGNDQRIYDGANLSQLYGKDSASTAQRKTYSHSVYAVVKGGIISLARYLAAYWGQKNIRVNCVSPGGVYHTGENELFLKKYSEKVPLGRKANLNEISGAVVYLASDEASYVTGQNIVVDGGWTAW